MRDAAAAVPCAAIGAIISVGIGHADRHPMNQSWGGVHTVGPEEVP